MTPLPAPAFHDIRSILTQLDAELYDEAIPFESTAGRMLSLTEATAKAILAQAGQWPKKPITLLAKAVGAIHRSDLLAARDFILDAMDRMPSRSEVHP